VRGFMDSIGSYDAKTHLPELWLLEVRAPRPGPVGRTTASRAPDRGGPR